MERSFVMIKPDGVQRELVGEVINRFERKGVKIVAMKMLSIDNELAQKHYGIHRDKPFFNELIEFITSSPVVAMVMEGENVINIIRKVVGATKVEEALPGTIRGDLVLDTGQNIIHASDSVENAKKEIELFFNKNEIVDYKLTVRPWIYSDK